jgi:hypothetical protein
MSEKATLAVDPEPEVVSAVKPKRTYKPKECRGCGTEFTPISSNQQNCVPCMPGKDVYDAVRQREARTAKKTEAKLDTASRTIRSNVELKLKDAHSILEERGLRNPHVIEFCAQLAETAARLNGIRFNHYLMAHGLRATLSKMKLPEIADEEMDGEILYRRDLHALWDYGFWRQPDVTFEQWLADRRKLKSSAFELAKILGKEDFGVKHEEWTSFAPRWNPIGLRPGYTQKQGLAWMDAQVSDTEGGKKRYLLVASRNSMKSTWVRILALCLTITYPDARILIISETNKLSKKAMKEFRGYLEMAPNSPTLFQQYFGEYTVASEGSALVYDNPLARLGLPQNSAESSSMESSNTGSRFDFCIFDDPISRDNGTGNEDQRAAAVSKFGSISKLREPSGFIFNVQTPWEIDDLGDVMIKRDQEDPEHPLAVRIDPVMVVKPEAHGKGWLELKEEDVVLNFLPKLNWRFVRDEMRSPEGIKFYRTQYMCEWVPSDESQITMQFSIEALRSKLRPRSFFDSTVLPGTPIYLALDRAFSVAATADFSSIAVVRVQPISEKRESALVVLDVVFGRWKTSSLIDRICDVIERYQPSALALEKDREVEELVMGIRQMCMRRNISMPYVILRDVKNGTQAKAAKIKACEAPLADGRLWFSAGSWNDACFGQFVRFDGVKKSGSSDGSKDDVPDSIALGYSIWGPRATDYQQLDPAQQRIREEEQEAEAAAQRRQHFYQRMHGNEFTGTRRNPAPPSLPAPTWRERATGRRDDAPPIIEDSPEPAAPQDPRMRIFGNKGPWRL